MVSTTSPAVSGLNAHSEFDQLSNSNNPWTKKRAHPPVRCADLTTLNRPWKRSACFQTNRSSLQGELCSINSKHMNYRRFAPEKDAKERWGDRTGPFFYCFHQGSANSDLAQRRLAPSVDGGEDRRIGKKFAENFKATAKHSEDRKTLSATLLFGFGEQHLPEGWGFKQTECLITSTSFQNSSWLSSSTFKSHRFGAVWAELLHALCSTVSTRSLKD